MIEALIDELILTFALIKSKNIEVTEISIKLPGGDLLVVK